MCLYYFLYNWFENHTRTGIRFCPRYRFQHVDFVAAAEQSEESEDEGFFVVDDVLARHEDLVFRICLYPLDEIFVFGPATGYQHDRR